MKYLNREILRLSIPNIVSNISIPLVGAVDTILMGHLSAAHLAALGIVGTIFMFIYGSLNFLRSGTTGITAQYYGAKNRVDTTLYRAILVSLILGFIIIVFRDAISSVSFYFMNINGSYTEYAKGYFDIRIYASFAVFLNYAIMGWFFGMQNSVVPLIMTIILNITNILLSYYLVVSQDLGITGAAIGTVVSQYLSVIIGVLFILKHKRFFKKLDIGVIFKKDELKRFFIVNRDFFIRTVALTLAFAFFYAQAAKIGVTELAVMTILVQFIMWFSYFIDGFANATESLVGKYFGAKSYQELDGVIRVVFIWGFFISLAFIAIFIFFGKNIAMLYSDNLEIINGVQNLMPIIILSPIFGFAAYIWDGVFIGMTASRHMRDAVLISFLIYILLYYSLRSFGEIYALSSSFLLFFLLRGLIGTYQFKRIKSARDNVRY